MSRINSLWALKQKLEEQRDLVKRGAKYKKAEWLEILEDLTKDAEHLEDYVHQDCYSSDCIQEMVDEQIRDQERALRDKDPEEHRKLFGVIQGGAA